MRKSLLTLLVLLISSSAYAQDADAVLDSAKALLEDIESPKAPAAPPLVKHEKRMPPSAISLGFAPEQTELSDEQKQKLNNLVIGNMRDNPDLKLEIQAYASGTPAQESHARRTSLERALAVQSYLLENNIPERAIYPRALGLRESGPADEVLLLLSR